MGPGGRHDDRLNGWIQDNELLNIFVEDEILGFFFYVSFYLFIYFVLFRSVRWWRPLFDFGFLGIS